MPTLGQALQNLPEPIPRPRILTVLAGSNPDTIQTVSGPVVNGLWGNATVGYRVIVIQVEGIDVAVGLLRPPP